MSKLPYLVTCSCCGDKRLRSMLREFQGCAKVGGRYFCSAECVVAFFSNPPKGFVWRGTFSPRAWEGEVYDICLACHGDADGRQFQTVDAPYGSCVDDDSNEGLWVCSPACVVKAFSPDLESPYLRGQGPWYDPFFLELLQELGLPEGELSVYSASL